MHHQWSLMRSFDQILANGIVVVAQKTNQILRVGCLHNITQRNSQLILQTGAWNRRLH